MVRLGAFLGVPVYDHEGEVGVSGLAASQAEHDGGAFTRKLSGICKAACSNTQVSAKQSRTQSFFFITDALFAFG